MTEYDLGKVVGDDGQDGVDGSDGSTIWYTSTAPTYANSKYTFTISNLSGKTGFTIAVNDLIFYDTYYYIVSTVNSTTVDCSTRVSIKGSDASVTIQTSWGSTTSDSKVPSEKLTKDSLDDKVSKSNTTGLLKNDGTVMTSGTGSSNYSAGNHTHSGYVSATKVTSWSSTVSDSNVPSEKLVKNTIDGLSIPTKTSDLTNDGADGTNVFVANNDSRLSDSRTPTSHTHGNLTNDGKVGSNANYIVVTGTGGAITSVQKLGNITYDGKIGSTSGKPVITTTSGTVTTGSFGTSSGTFAEGNHTHSNYISTSSTTGLIKNDGTIMTSGTGSTNYAAGNHTHSGYATSTHSHGYILNDGTVTGIQTPSISDIFSGFLGVFENLDDVGYKIIPASFNTDYIKNTSALANLGATANSTQAYINGKINTVIATKLTATKVTSWSSTTSDSNVPSEKLVKDSLDDIEDLIGDAIQYINM